MPFKKSNKNPTREFPAHLRNRMNERGINAAELARRINVSQTAVSKWLSGENAPGPHSLFKLEQELGVDEGCLAVELDDATKEVSSPINVEQGPETIADMIESLRIKIARVSGYDLDRVKLSLEFE